MLLKILSLYKIFEVKIIFGIGKTLLRLFNRLKISVLKMENYLNIVTLENNLSPQVQ